MSTLTKVFALLVSALSIFICGVVVTFITNTQNWKQAYQDQKTLTEAAQVQALAANMDLTRARELNKLVIQRLQDNIAAVQQFNNSLARQLAIQKQAGADKASQAGTAVQTMKALRLTIQNMFDAQIALQKALDENRGKMIASQTQMIDLTHQLNSLQVDNNQLKSIRKQQIEKIYELEEENAALRQKIEKVTLASTEFQGNEQVSLTTPQKVGVPIRGMITEIDGEKAAISVGSSSGVRQNMTFWITRGDKFLGNMKITHVEASESVGQMSNQQGVIVTGDSVTTGFD